MTYPVLFTHVDGHLGCFLFSVIMNKDIVIIHLQSFVVALVVVFVDLYFHHSHF